MKFSLKYMLFTVAALLCTFCAVASGSDLIYSMISGADLSTLDIIEPFAYAMTPAVFVSTDKNRGAYERVAAKIQDIFGPGSLSEYIIHEMDLRLETLLNASKDTVTWDLLSGNNNNDGPAEIRLDKNDMFFITDWAIAVTKRDPVNGLYGDYQDYTYPEATFFVGNNSESLSVGNLYKATVDFKTGNVLRIQDFSTQNFLYVPERIAPAAGQYQQYGPSKEGRGFIPVNPSPIIDGSQNNIFTLNMIPGTRTGIEGTVDGAGAAVDTRNVAVLKLKGFVVRNAAEKGLRFSRTGKAFF